MSGLTRALRQGGLALRPIAEADLPFLHQVYAGTRAAELAQLPWSEEQKQAFLRQQFDAQHRHYQAAFAGDRFDLVLLDGVPVGRLYVGRWAREIRVIDIALLPRCCGRGLGSRLLGELIEEGERTGKPVSVSVEKFNPARRLYQRLGFVQTEDLGVYDLLVRPCAAPKPG